MYDISFIINSMRNISFVDAIKKIVKLPSRLSLVVIIMRIYLDCCTRNLTWTLENAVSRDSRTRETINIIVVVSA